MKSKGSIEQMIGGLTTQTNTQNPPHESGKDESKDQSPPKKKPRSDKYMVLQMGQSNDES